MVKYNDNEFETKLKIKFTVLSKNTRILKLKRQLMFAFFAPINNLNRPLRKQKFTSVGSKGHGLQFVIGGFQSILCVCFVCVRVHCL